jgi:hypothetical protein
VLFGRLCRPASQDGPAGHRRPDSGATDAPGHRPENSMILPIEESGRAAHRPGSSNRASALPTGRGWGIAVSDPFGSFSLFWNQLLSFVPWRTEFVHLGLLAHRTWPIALAGWFGFRLLLRSTGRVVYLLDDLLFYGCALGFAMLLMGGLGVEGSGIVHALYLSLLGLGSAVWIVSTIARVSRLHRQQRGED